MDVVWEGSEHQQHLQHLTNYKSLKWCCLDVVYKSSRCAHCTFCSGL